MMLGYNIAQSKVLLLLYKRKKISVSDGLRICRTLRNFNYTITLLIKEGIVVKTCNKNNSVILYELTPFGADLGFCLGFHGKV